MKAHILSIFRFLTTFTFIGDQLNLDSFLSQYWLDNGPRESETVACARDYTYK